MNGHEAIAAVFAGVDILGLVALFLGARVIERKQEKLRSSDDETDQTEQGIASID